MKIENPKYVKDKTTDTNGSISATIEGQVWSVPISIGNTHYDEIKRQVDAGELTIADAD